MARGIYVGAMTPTSGKSLISLGLMDTLHTSFNKVGFFRPLTEADNVEDDPMVKLMRKRYDLDESSSRAALTKNEARDLIASGERDEIDSKAVAIFSDISKKCDIVVVEGTSVDGPEAAVEFEMNTRLANNLGCPMLMVVGADGAKDAKTVAEDVELARKELHEANVPIFAVIVNRSTPEQVEEIKKLAPRGEKDLPIYVLPDLDQISNPTMEAITQSLDAEVISGNDNLDRDISGIKVAAMTVNNFLEALTDECLVIVPGDRGDIMTATLASALTPEFPKPSGMLLSYNMKPEGRLKTMMDQAPFPVITADLDTYEAARSVSNIHGNFFGGQPRKIAAALGTWSSSVDSKELTSRLDLPRPETKTPLRFLHELIERAQQDRKHIVLPEGTDERILEAAEIIKRRDICDLTILGPVDQIKQLAASKGTDISGIDLIDPTTSEMLEDFSATYAKLRAHKGITEDQARERMMDASYFGTMMVYKGMVDGMVSGAAHSTANTIRPALEFIKTVAGVKVVSSVFLMLLEDRVLVYGDCAVNPNPNAEQLADIAVASAETASNFDVEPRIAMLSYSTGESGSGEDVEEVRQATELVKERRPDLKVEGPIQYDAASNASIAKSKMPDSQVAGKATVFIFPDLNTGNNTYKAVQQSSGAVAVGPVLQGLKKPVNDLSRGCTVEDIVNTVAITAIQAQSTPSSETSEDTDSTASKEN
ncbi:MAG: phosphate acetyltransferase [Micrococcaceae bacterium]